VQRTRPVVKTAAEEKKANATPVPTIMDAVQTFTIENPTRIPIPCYTDSKYLVPLATLLMYMNGIRVKRELSHHELYSLFHSPEDAIKTLIDDNYIDIYTPADWSENCTITECKDLLREHNLPVSGNKALLVTRISSAIPEKPLVHFMRQIGCYTLTSKGQSVVTEYASIRKATIDQIYHFLLNKNALEAVKIWAQYNNTYNNMLARDEDGIKNRSKGLIDTYKGSLALCEAYMQMSYTELQNTDTFKNKVAAVFALAHLCSLTKNKELIPYLYERTSETIKCKALEREILNNYETDESDDDDTISPDIILYDYRHELMRRALNYRQISMMQEKLMNNAYINRVNCNKIDCDCMYKDKNVHMSLEEGLLFPYKIRCYASFGYEFYS
jgi:hypothetical protein